MRLSLILLLPFQLFGQLDYLDVSIATKEQMVYIEWSVERGHSCEDVQVQHSTDSLNFKTIHVHSGICGDPAEITFYEYIHKNPVAGPNYYRIKVNQEVTQAVHTILHDRPLLIFPNPFNTGLRISPLVQVNEIEIQLLSLSGKKLKTIIIDPSQDMYVDLSEIPSGVYFISYTIQNSVYQEKVVKF